VQKYKDSEKKRSIETKLLGLQSKYLWEEINTPRRMYGGEKDFINYICSSYCC
jgi:hypothetical protein